MRSKFINKVSSGLLALTLVVGSMLGYASPVSAYETNVTDGSIAGTRSDQSVKGDNSFEMSFIPDIFTCVWVDTEL